jgi:regulator of protease activity HflC (stomatin/prohibitin superfamily)
MTMPSDSAPHSHASSHSAAPGGAARTGSAAQAPASAYARASRTSLLGLALQVVLGLALLIYAFLAKDRTAFSGATFVLLMGIPWIVLAMLFDQHRRERLEAMEEQAILSAGQNASAFGDAAQELRVAHKRLAWMHRVLVPAISLILALALGGAGAAFFTFHKKYVDENFVQTHFGWALALGVILGVVGFIFARFIAGMSKVPHWSNLRGGAGSAVAASLVGVGLGVAHFAAYFNADLPARYLHLVYPSAMVLIGVEIILNILLGLYRPRSAGEMPRPALDSRLLSFIATPDRLAKSIGEALNYQFGFNVTDSWFYQLVARWLGVLACVGLVVVWLMTSLAIVQPNEQGMILRFGKPRTDTLQPGLYVKAPWPIDVLETIDATTVRSVQLASEPPKVTRSILWTNDHGVTETFFAVQPSDAAGPAAESIMSGLGPAAPADAASGLPAGTPGAARTEATARDLALVAAEVPLYYVVSDYAEFRNLVAPEHRDQFLRAIGRRELVEFLATQSVDGVLGERRAEIGRQIADRINKRLAQLNGGKGAGVSVRYVALVGVHPPRETAGMFESVVQARQTRMTNLQAARTFADSELIKVAGSVETAQKIVGLLEQFQTAGEQARNQAAGPAGAQEAAKKAADLEHRAAEILLAGKGTAADLLTEASAARWVRHMDARIPAERFASRLALFNASPKVYRAQIYFDTLKEVLGKSRVFIIADDENKVEIRLNAEDSNLSNQLFDAPKAIGEPK